MALRKMSCKRWHEFAGLSVPAPPFDVASPDPGRVRRLSIAQNQTFKGRLGGAAPYNNLAGHRYWKCK